MFGDLHNHSRYSDGSLSVRELIAVAARLGLPVIALTDHDTMAGWAEALACGEEKGICVIPGVEFSTRDPETGRKAHLLVYAPEKPELLRPYCEWMAQERRRSAEIMLKKIMEKYPIDWDLVLRCANGCVTIFKQHIMLALMEAGYADQLYGPLFRQLFGKDGMAHVPVRYPDVHEVARAARAAGGTIVLAHPGEYHSLPLLREMAKAGEIDGAEYWHPRNTPQDQEEIARVCGEYRLLKTGGTDFHGSHGDPRYPVGSFITPEKELRAFLDHVHRVHS